MANKIEFEWNNVLQEIKVLNSLDFPSRCLNYSQCVTGNTNEESLNTGISLLSFRDTFFLPPVRNNRVVFLHFCTTFFIFVRLNPGKAVYLRDEKTIM